MKVVLDDGAYMPEKAHNDDAGFDLRTPCPVRVRPHSWETVDTGVHLEIPKGYVGMIKTKSGVNVKRNCLTEGVVDSGYTGSIMVKIYNFGQTEQCFEKGDKITQIVLIPFISPDLVLSDKLDETERGNDGFGSTDKTPLQCDDIFYPHAIAQFGLKIYAITETECKCVCDMMPRDIQPAYEIWEKTGDKYFLLTREKLKEMLDYILHFLSRHNDHDFYKTINYLYKISSEITLVYQLR